jgi:hypothetical protein
MSDDEWTKPSEPDVDVEDDTDRDETVPSVAYEITSYGADPEAELLVRRQQREEILVPPFQRGFVWSQPKSSRFIESLLLGLPVPGIFLAEEAESRKQLVIDGQQRLKSLRFFYEGYFNPRVEDATRRVFTLEGVQKPFSGRTYATLDQRDRIRLDTAIIHSTIIKQTSPPSDDTSLYHIFERLNTGGLRLTAQEIRSALYHGPLLKAVSTLNEEPCWRTLFGRKHSRLKDQELILRFFALFYDRGTYQRPMHEFLSKFASKHRSPSPSDLKQFEDLFRDTCQGILDDLGAQAFRPEGRLNVALADALMVGVAVRLSLTETGLPSMKASFSSLMADKEFLQATQRSTADEAQVALRIQKSIAAFTGA